MDPSNNQLGIVRLLSRIFNAGSMSRLMEYAMEGNIKQVARIIEKNPKAVTWRNSQSWTALMVACSTPAAGAKMVAFLLEKGSDINAKDKLGVTPLLIATGSCRAELIDCLMESGADPTVCPNLLLGDSFWNCKAAELADRLHVPDIAAKIRTFDLAEHRQHKEVAAIQLQEKIIPRVHEDPVGDIPVMSLNLKPRRQI